jgi:hypothetical protein
VFSLLLDSSRPEVENRPEFDKLVVGLVGLTGGEFGAETTGKESRDD